MKAGIDDSFTIFEGWDQFDVAFCVWRLVYTIMRFQHFYTLPSFLDSRGDNYSAYETHMKTILEVPWSDRSLTFEQKFSAFIDSIASLYLRLGEADTLRF